MTADPLAVEAAHASRLADKVSGDSGLLWSEPGAWPVADGVHRVPLPLPMDGLRAVNVYVLASEEGLTLVDGGWAIAEAREALEGALRSLGCGLRDVRRFLVTHVHRDHYTLAAQVAAEVGAEVHLGLPERPTVEAFRSRVDGGEVDGSIAVALHEAGAHRHAERYLAGLSPSAPADLVPMATPPSHWLEGEQRLEVGSRALDAVPTPGHTRRALRLPRRPGRPALRRRPRAAPHHAVDRVRDLPAAPARWATSWGR